MNAPPDDTHGSPARLERRFTSDPANIAPVRRAVEDLATSAGFDEKATGEIGLCVNEALANITLHAYDGRSDGPVLLVAEKHPAEGSKSLELHVTIRDWGNGVNPAALPLRPRDPHQPGGLGMVCIGSLMDQIDFTPQPDGMMVTLVKRRTED